jgi:hypothetical protein
VFVTTTRTNLSDSETTGNRKAQERPVLPKRHIQNIWCTFLNICGAAKLIPLAYFWLREFSLPAWGNVQLRPSFEFYHQTQENLGHPGNLPLQVLKLVPFFASSQGLPSLLLDASISLSNSQHLKNSSTSDGAIDAVRFSSSLQHYSNTNPYIGLRSTHLSYIKSTSHSQLKIGIRPAAPVHL